MLADDEEAGLSVSLCFTACKRALVNTLGPQALCSQVNRAYTVHGVSVCVICICVYVHISVCVCMCVCVGVCWCVCVRPLRRPFINKKNAKIIIRRDILLLCVARTQFVLLFVPL